MVTSVHRSSCSEKVKVGKNFEAYQEKFRGGQELSAGLMQTSALPSAQPYKEGTFGVLTRYC